MPLDTVINAGAYIGMQNSEYPKEKDIKIEAKLNSVISNGVRTEQYKFDYKKNVNIYACLQRHLYIIKLEEA